MRWLTRDLMSGRGSDRGSDAIREDYYARLRVLADTTTGPISELASCTDHRLDLSDAKIDSVRSDPSSRSVELAVVQGDLQVGYGRLVLRFFEATLDVIPAGDLPQIVSTPETEVWAWELERSTTRGNRFDLRLLFWPSGESSISFEAMTWAWESRIDRVSPPLGRLVD